MNRIRSSIQASWKTQSDTGPVVGGPSNRRHLHLHALHIFLHWSLGFGLALQGFVWGNFFSIFVHVVNIKSRIARYKESACGNAGELVNAFGRQVQVVASMQ